MHGLGPCGFQHVYDGAVGHMTARTLLDGSGKVSFQASEIVDLAPDFFEVMNRNCAHFVAARFGRTAQVQKCPHFRRRKAKLARPLDEFECAKVTVVENPVSACCAIRRTEHSDLLEIPDRLDIDAGLARQLTYGQAAHVESP